MSPQARARRRTRATDALLAMSILLPAVLFALAGWQGYREAMREATLGIERTIRVLREHSAKVFETHTLVLDQIRDRQRHVNWDDEADRADLHQVLKRLQDQLDQVAMITIVDADGKLLASSRAHPVDRSTDLSDRDWFQALRAGEGRIPYVSKSYPAGPSEPAVFNVAGRSWSPTGEFAGAIAVSVDRGYLERFYQEIEPEVETSVMLVRGDGEVLARHPPSPRALLAADSALRRQIAVADGGMYTTESKSDGVERVFGYSRVGSFPVYVRFGITTNEILAPWRRNLVKYGLVAVFASLVLLGVSGYAIWQSRREQLAAERWRDAAMELENQAASRREVEDQLRQAQKMEAVGQLTGGIAHDFNNLLTGIVGSLDLLQRRLRQGRTEGIERYAAAATASANRAAALTHRLLAFARRQPLDPKPVDVNELVRSLADLLRRTIGETIGLDIRTTDGLWPTLCDPHQLESAVLNLAINARDAMPGGGTLTVETANTWLDAAFAAAHPGVKPGPYVRISVGDTGTGMSPDVVQRAFEPFFTTKPLGQGTGLGLSMIYGFARQSEGHAAIESSIGEGTTVSIYLPRHRGEAAPAEGRPSPSVALPAPARVETVLVVEDEAVVRDLVVEVVRDLGLQALSAPDGAGGLHVLRSSARIDLLVTDVGLPGINGRELAEEARRARGDLPVLFITGYSEEAAPASGFLAPGMALMTKPFSVEALADKLREMLDQRDAA